jgi:hypothetical protein
LETAAQVQRFWLDQWTRWSELGLTWLTPATARQVDERLEAAERRAAEREAQMRAGLERVAGDLQESQKEAGREQARAFRDATREQQAARASLDEALESLNRRLDGQARAQAKQIDELKTALAEQEQRLRTALGARVRTAVSAIEAATPEDLEPLRDQMAALTRATTATRKEVAELGHDLHDEKAADGHSAASDGSPGGDGARSKASDKRRNA